MGEFLFIGTSCHVAGPPTYIPGTTPDKNHALVTLMVNRKTRAGNQVTDEITANFWAKNASVAANYLGTGKQCNIRGRSQSYNQATGRILPNNKAEINRRIEVTVTRCELLADSRKAQEAELAVNINRLKAEGRLPAAVILTMDDLFSKKATMVDFNPAVAIQTGSYGHAKVWSKDVGFWGNGIGQVAAIAPAVIPAGNQAEQIASIEKMLAMLKAAPVANPADVVPLVADVVPAVAAEVAAIEDPFTAGQ